MEARPTSWVIRRRADGRVIRETFNHDVPKRIAADPELSAQYEVIPILDYLASLNTKEPQ